MIEIINEKKRVATRVKPLAYPVSNETWERV